MRKCDATAEIRPGLMTTTAAGSGAQIVFTGVVAYFRRAPRPDNRAPGHRSVRGMAGIAAAATPRRPREPTCSLEFGVGHPKALN